VKNPAGGDTLALYFEFDEDEMNPRTRRQLEIVSLILKSDPGKRLTLSGHTDSLGTEDYNRSLSARRADVVREFLIKAGVPHQRRQPTGVTETAAQIDF
jgi:OmpA-OmpF porin, OOP family